MCRFRFSLSGAIPLSVYGQSGVSVHFSSSDHPSARFSPSDTLLGPFQSGVLAACRSELGRLEQLLALVDPPGLCRRTSSPYRKPTLVELRGKASVVCETNTSG